MKTFTTILIAAFALVLTSCDHAERLGQQAAGRLQEAWHSDDTTALTQFVAYYASLDDSLSLLDTRRSVNKAFIQAGWKQSDTLGIASEIIANGEESAATRAEQLVDNLLGGDLNAQQACDRIGLAQTVASRLNQPQWTAKYCQAIDDAARNLPLDKQMALYAKACPPAELARQLTAERNAPNADTAMISKQIEALRRIYSAEQMTEFNNAYNR